MSFNWPEFDSDDPGFMLCATELVHGFVGGMALPRYQTFRIDNWFGPKWLGFCGKLVGAVGVANFRNVVIPPFVQNRLTAQSLFVCSDDGTYLYQGDGPQIHNIGTSASNFKNYALVRARWLEREAEHLLPVPYYHVVFTLPAELSGLALANPTVLYDLLFQSAAATLRTVAANPKRL